MVRFGLSDKVQEHIVSIKILAIFSKICSQISLNIVKEVIEVDEFEKGNILAAAGK